MAYFAHGTAAERYARWRPDVHGEFVARLGKRGVLAVAAAADVGCGTGQSTRVLATRVPQVVGIEPAAGMLAQASAAPGVAYVRAAAEALPLADGAAGLVTAALAFHWFDADRFAAEALRVLAPGGHLVVYDSWFTAEMDGAPGFRDWFTGEHLPRYPTPPRNRVPLDEGFAAAHGFEPPATERFSQAVTMTADQLAGYVLTQTNVIAAVEEGAEPIEQAAEWVAAGTGRFFEGRERVDFTFGGRIVCLRKPDAS